MNDDNNQIIEEVDYFLPDDYEEPEAEDTTEAEEVEEVAEETEEPTTEDSESVSEEETTEVDTEVTEEVEVALKDLDIKFLHDSKKLGDYSAEEIKTIFQKGLNNDRLIEKVNVATEKTEKIKELAELYKMNDTDLIDALYDQYFKAEAKNTKTDVSTVKSKYEATKKQTTQKMYDRFLAKHKDIDVKSIPQEVWNSVKEGEDLTRAYENYQKETTIQSKSDENSQLKQEILELKKKLDVKTNNEKVKKKAVVKSTSKNGTDKTEGDDFLSGFLS